MYRHDAYNDKNLIILMPQYAISSVERQHDVKLRQTLLKHFKYLQNAIYLKVNIFLKKKKNHTSYENTSFPLLSVCNNDSRP